MTAKRDSIQSYKLNHMSDPATPAAPKTVSGKYVVIVMFLFASFATSLLWYYWYYHNAPFVPLQKALAEEFIGCQPRVDGGQRKMHLGTPKLLWVILRMPFKPDDDPSRSRKVAERVRDLVREKLPPDDFESLTVRLFFGEPERVLHKLDFEFSLATAAKP